MRSEEALKSITVADVSGKIVIEADLKGQNSANINVGGIVSGVYVVTATATNGNKSTIKTIKE